MPSFMLFLKSLTLTENVRLTLHIKPLLNTFVPKSLRKMVSMTILVLISFGAVAQPIQIWGASDRGGADQIGTVFNLFNDGTAYTMANEFNNTADGANPQAAMLLAEDGLLYGITGAGGLNGAGTVYSFHEMLGLIVLAHLDPLPHGSAVRAPLTEIEAGEFITASSQGGNSAAGVLLHFSVDEGLTALAAFNGTITGSTPRGAIVFEPNSETIYGTCTNGGSNGFGTIFKYNIQDGLTAIHHFTGGAGGSFPQGGLCLGADGALYGTTQFGGANSQGSVFKYNLTSVSHEVIYSLSNASIDGRYPFGALIEAEPGLFLGTCAEGGSSGVGTIFSISDTGDFVRLRSLISGADGAFPKTGLTQIEDDTFYGMCEFGGSTGFGTAYSITTAGVFAKIHDLNYTDDGSNPIGGLARNLNGTAFGLARNGGTNDAGTIFSVGTDEGLMKLHDFSLPENGAHPVGLTTAGNTFFGLTRAGGEFNAGIFFKTELNGERTKLFDFEDVFEGRYPNSDLLLHSDGLYYGSTRFGGIGNAGTLFRISAEGDFTLLHTFDSSDDGQFPYGGLTDVGDGYFYGTTVAGGLFGDGTVYRITPEGEHTKLVDLFSFFDGAAPEATLKSTPEGQLLGLASGGGDFSQGTLFSFDPSTNAISVLHHFDGISGAAPKHQLYAHGDGHYYGTATSGGSGSGTLFRYQNDAGLEVIHTFSALDGSAPSGSLTADNGGVLYGFCQAGGSFGMGTCYAYGTSGFEKIYDFSTNESAEPHGVPVLFYPECGTNDACSSSAPCSVGQCNFGLCEEVAIAPEFSVALMGSCNPMDNTFVLELEVTLQVNPGGSITIGGASFDLPEGALSFILEIPNLDADGQPIELDYSFDATGCSGVSTGLDTAPAPCPPVTISMVLDLAGFEPGADGLFVGGNWQNWSPSENPMTEGMDGIWEITLGLSEGEFEFNFFDGPSLFDAEYVLGSCALNGKRQLTVSESNDTLYYCWQSCENNCFLGVKDHFGNAQMQLWPNPVTNGQDLHFKLNADHKALAYYIVDPLGRKVDANILGSYGDGIVSTAMLTKGMYTLIVYDLKIQTPTAAARFIVQ
jgi:uncharacterized repeat protein (TIGR03803 family)